jgi:hypothetical protein
MNNLSALYQKTEHAHFLIRAADRRARAIMRWAVADEAVPVDRLRWAWETADIMRTIADDWGEDVYWRCERFMHLSLRDPVENHTSEYIVEQCLHVARRVRAKLDELGTALLEFCKTGAAADDQYEEDTFDVPDHDGEMHKRTLQETVLEMELAVQRAIEALTVHETVLRAWPPKLVGPGE